MFIAISAAGAFRTDDGGANLEAHQSRPPLRTTSPTPPPKSATASTTSPCTPAAPARSSCRSTGTSCAPTTAGDTWHEVSGNLPTDFGFAIDVHAHEPETIYVVPIKSDSEHFPLDGQLRVYRSRTGGNEWEPLTKGLPQPDCYVNVLRDAMAVDTLDTCGIYFGTTGGQVYASPNAGDNWSPIVRDLPAVLSVEVQTLHMNQHQIRVELPAHLRTLAKVTGEVCSASRQAPSRSAPSSTPSKPITPCSAEPSATTTPSSAAPSCASSPASRISPTNPPTPHSPKPSSRA